MTPHDADPVLERQVGELGDAADALMAEQRYTEAAASYERMRVAVAELSNRFPDDDRHRRMAASVAYSLAAAYSESGRAAQAIGVLDEAQRMYTALVDEGTPGAIARGADVRARRGLAHLRLGHGASAVADLGGAVTVYRDLVEAGHPLLTDLGRVLAMNAHVLARFGDPAMSALAAGEAVRCFTTAGADEDSAYAGYLAMARDAAVNSGKDADQALAPTLERVAALLPGDKRPLTLAALLADSAALTPSARCTPQSAPPVARELVELGLDVLGFDIGGDSDDEPPYDAGYALTDGVRLVLEGHFMLAASSEAQAGPLWQAFGDYAVPWAAGLLAASRAYRDAADDLDMAVDLARWCSELMGHLVPMASGDPRVRGLVAECLVHHGRLCISTGDIEEGELWFSRAREFTS